MTNPSSFPYMDFHARQDDYIGSYPLKDSERSAKRIDRSSPANLFRSGETKNKKAKSSQEELEDKSHRVLKGCHLGRLYFSPRKPRGLCSNSISSTLKKVSFRASSMSSCISSRMSHPFRRINSVLSSSKSCRVSMVNSVSSDKSSTSERLPSRDKSNTWSVEEPANLSHDSNSSVKSLYSRPCCGLFGSSLLSQKSCNTCGFAYAHQVARLTSFYNPNFRLDTNIQDKFGNTALHFAASAGNLSFLMSILSYVADINHRNTSGETFLHVIKCERPEMIPMFLSVIPSALDLGFKLGTPNHNGRTAARILYDMRAQWSTSIVYPGFEAIERLLEIEWRSVKTIEGFDQQTTFLKDQKPNVGEALISIIKKRPQKLKSQEQLKHIIKTSDVNMRDERGYTALALSAGIGIREAVSMLLDSGANPNTRSHQNSSVIGYATSCLAKAQRQNEEELYGNILSCIILLVDHGAKLVPTDYDEYFVFVPIKSRNRLSTIKSSSDLESESHPQQAELEDTYRQELDSGAQIPVELDARPVELNAQGSQGFGSLRSLNTSAANTSHTRTSSDPKYQNIRSQHLQTRSISLHPWSIGIGASRLRQAPSASYLYSISPDAASFASPNSLDETFGSGHLTGTSTSKTSPSELREWPKTTAPRKPAAGEPKRNVRIIDWEMYASPENKFDTVGIR